MASFAVTSNPVAIDAAGSEPDTGAHAVASAPTELAAPLPPVEREMARILESLNLPSNLLDATGYALLGGGKRLRPILALHSCAAVGGTFEQATHAAAAVEMIHAFSLVHDDLPALDNDDLRRGRPTLHVAKGEAMAILAGDGLMSIAFQAISSGAYPDALAGALCRELAEGTTRMIAGQVYDTLGGFPDGLTPREQLDLIHVNKTGALIRAACRMGALCGLWKDGAAEPNALRAISVYGDSVGLMFQIVDDLLDVEQSAEHIGKRTSKDQEAGKRTFPGIVGIETSRREIARLREQAIDALTPFGARAEALRRLCDYLAVRTS